MSAQMLLFAVLVIGDMALWIAGAIAPLSPTGRFRARAAATLLLLVLCGSAIGWSWTLAAAALALWLAAIVSSGLGGRGVMD
jgi:hypothetical protein